MTRLHYEGSAGWKDIILEDGRGIANLEKTEVVSRLRQQCKSLLSSLPAEAETESTEISETLPLAPYPSNHYRLDSRLHFNHIDGNHRNYERHGWFDELDQPSDRVSKFVSEPEDHFVRYTVPLASLLPPPQMRPKLRRDYEPGESIALRDNMHAGYRDPSGTQQRQQYREAFSAQTQCLLDKQDRLRWRLQRLHQLHGPTAAQTREYESPYPNM